MGLYPSPLINDYLNWVIAWQRDVFSAGASHYGVADLELLAKETHKFESRYLDGLVGPWPVAAAIYKERSPIEALEKFDKPVAFFQVSGYKSFATTNAQLLNMYLSLLTISVNT